MEPRTPRDSEPLAVHRVGGRLCGWTASSRARPGSLPRNLVLPWAFSSQRVGEVARAGPYGGFLGQAYDPICTEFVGKGTKTARKTLTDQVWEDVEPYRGITPESRFQLERRRRSARAGADARSARRSSYAAGTNRTLSTRGRCNCLALGHCSPSRDGIRPALIRETARVVRPGRGAGRNARALRDVSVRAGGLDRTPAGRGRRPVHHRFLG